MLGKTCNFGHALYCNKSLFRRYQIVYRYLTVSSLIDKINFAGNSNDGNAVCELWTYAERNQLDKDIQCARAFLHWFSRLGKVDNAIDTLSKLLPNATTDDTLQLLQTYSYANQPKQAFDALRLLLSNKFELTRDHFHCVLRANVLNGNLDNIDTIFAIMKSNGISPNSETAHILLQNFDTFLYNAADPTAIDIHSAITTLQTLLTKHHIRIQKATPNLHSSPYSDPSHGYNSSSSTHTTTDESTLSDNCGRKSMLAHLKKLGEHFGDSGATVDLLLQFMRWYCHCGDVSNANLFLEEVLMTHCVPHSHVHRFNLEKLGLFFKNRISLSESLTCLNDIITSSQSIGSHDYSVLLLFDDDMKPDTNACRKMFEILCGIPSERWHHTSVLNLLLYICTLNNDLHNALYIVEQCCIIPQKSLLNENDSDASASVVGTHPSTQLRKTSLFRASSNVSINLTYPITCNDYTLTYIAQLFQLASEAFSGHSTGFHIQQRTLDWSVQLWEWLVRSYLLSIETQSSSTIDSQTMQMYYDNIRISGERSHVESLLNSIAQNLLQLLVYDSDNLQSFCFVLQYAYYAIPNFKPDGSIFGILGAQIVGKETRLESVFAQSARVLKFLTKKFEMLPIASSDASLPQRREVMLTSVTDRALLLGSILHHYDENICANYGDTIGGSEHLLYNMRHDLQQQLTLRIHKQFSLFDVLSLDVTSVLGDDPNPPGYKDRRKSDRKSPQRSNHRSRSSYRNNKMDKKS